MKKSLPRRVVKKFMRHRTAWVVMICVLALLVVYSVSMHNKRLSVDPNTYGPLLNLIAEVESRGNYNAYFGNASNTSVDFTSMTVGEVLGWQSEYIEDGSPSSAVGRYQIINTTLTELIEQHGISKNEVYDEKLQDKLAVKLLERRGSEAYVNSELSRDEFAANLAKEWASLPKVVGDNPSDSFYEGDGLNKSLVEVDEVLDAIKPISPKL